MKKLAAVAALSLTAFGANATTYIISSSSTMDNVRKIGGQNIPEICDYTGNNAPSCGAGGIDPTNPANWPILDSDIFTNPNYTGYPSTAPTGIEPNAINVDGTISVTAGTVTAAIINQLDPLGYITYQSASVQNNLVTTNLVWTYNPATSQLNHQASGSWGACVAVSPPATGTGISGQCSQLVAAVNASGSFGQTTIANSIWNWAGMAANYTVRDTSTTPWHGATHTAADTLQRMAISGVGGHAGVIWDLTGFVDGVGGTIIGRTVADALTGNSATGMAATYTLNVQVVPVPAAVWFFGSALGLLGLARRRLAR